MRRKDKPFKILYPEDINDWVTVFKINGSAYISKVRGAKTKKKRKLDIEWHWMTTPGWWIRLMMGRPERARNRAWEQKVLYDIDLDYIDTGRKPHIYYW